MTMAPLGPEHEAALRRCLAEFRPRGREGVQHSVKEQERTRVETWRCGE